MNIKLTAKEVFNIESKAITNLSNLLTDDFEKAVKLILKTKGKTIISGMGKSGIIGKKISATLASTGTSSFFIHPAEAYHGDLGMIEKKDTIILISNSGETEEILRLISYLKKQKNKLISITGNPESTIAKNTNYHLNISVEKEACPLRLAPTSSTTATLVMGDALAVSLMKMRKFKDINFAKLHPGGSLGKRLIQTVEDVMKKENLPVCLETSKITQIIHTITNGKVGLVVVKNKKKIVGVISDGDIRRSMEKNKKEFFNITAKNLMTCNPKIILNQTSLVKASQIMHKKKISALLVVDKKNKFVGIVQLFDLGI